MKHRANIVALLLCLLLLVADQSLNGKVVAISDGDTLTVINYNIQIKIISRTTNVLE